MDKVKEMFSGASDTAAKHGDKITDGVDKATDVVDDKTGGKYTDHLEKVDDATRSAVDKAGGDQTDGGDEGAADTAG